MKKSKKIIMAISLAVIAFAALFVVWWTEYKPTIMVSSEKTPFGEKGYFTVSAKRVKDVCGVELAICFNQDAIRITEISNGTVFDSVSVSEEAYANNNGEIEVMYLDFSGGDHPIAMDGDLLYVGYETLKPLDSEVILDKVKIVNSNMDYDSSFRLVNGEIKSDAVH